MICIKLVRVKLRKNLEFVTGRLLGSQTPILSKFKFKFKFGLNKICTWHYFGGTNGKTLIKAPDVPDVPDVPDYVGLPYPT